jgi:light-regulated signal transduction histidine kinase (bacteriophytochrome)
MTVSIVVRKRLWGMIACHHPAPRAVDCSTRTVCELLGRHLALQVDLRNYRAFGRSSRTSRTQLDDYMRRIEAASTVDAQALQSAQLLALFDADGLISNIEGEVSYRGTVATEDTLLAVIGMLRKLLLHGVASSNLLGALHKSAESYAASVSGALYLQLSERGDDYLMLVRRELVETIQWAGNPEKAMIADADGRLQPRKSFIAWRETVRGRARPWTEIQLENARLLSGQLMRLRALQKLRMFEHAAGQGGAR